MSHTTPEDKFHFIVGIEVLLGTSTVKRYNGYSESKKLSLPKMPVEEVKEKALGRSLTQKCRLGRFHLSHINEESNACRPCLLLL